MDFPAILNCSGESDFDGAAGGVRSRGHNRQRACTKQTLRSVFDSQKHNFLIESIAPFARLILRKFCVRCLCMVFLGKFVSGLILWFWDKLWFGDLRVE